jgi:hypothetical protein
MNSLWLNFYYLVLTLACVFTFYAGYKLAGVVVSVLLRKLFPAKKLELHVHNEVGLSEKIIIKSNDYMALVDAILAEAKFNKSKDKLNVIGDAEQ